MKNWKSILCLLVFVLAFIVAAAAADAPTLTLKITEIHPPDELQIIVNGVNNTGVKVGAYQDKNTAFHGFMLTGKKLTDIDDPNGFETHCRGINSDGAVAIVGDYYVSSRDTNIGFLYKDGKFTDIPGPAGSLTAFASGINNNGDIVGSYQDSSLVWHGFLLRGTTYTTLDVPDSSSTNAHGIDNKGNIVLNSGAGGCAGCAWLFNGKTYKKINVPGALASFPQGLSNNGDIVYEWLDAGYVLHGALRHGGKYYKFEFPGGVDTSATGINDHHVIVGTEVAHRDHHWHGFKVTY